MEYTDSSAPKRVPSQGFYASHNNLQYPDSLPDLAYSILPNEPYVATYGSEQLAHGARDLWQLLTPDCYNPCTGTPIPWSLALDSALVNSASRDAVPNSLLAVTLGSSSFTSDFGVESHSRVGFDGYYTASTVVGYDPFTSRDSWPSPSVTAGSTSPSPVPSGTSSERPFSCGGCSASFQHRKDLKRHKDTVHATGNERTYRCRCGKHGVRKDNYLRHAQGCNGQHRYSDYGCKCDVISTDKSIHITHVSKCQYGAGRSGRPRAA